MALIPLTIPPGVYANGTDYQASNRWLSSSLVRWTDGTMRPVGGWAERFDPSMSAPRGMLAWQDQDNDRTDVTITLNAKGPYANASYLA